MSCATSVSPVMSAVRSPKRVRGIMNLAPTTWVTIRRVYGAVHAVLWALLAASALAIIFNFPRMLEARTVAERQRVQEISEENKFYCEKWGLRANTHEHVICTMDLNEIRERAEKRVVEDISF